MGSHFIKMAELSYPLTLMVITVAYGRNAAGRLRILKTRLHETTLITKFVYKGWRLMVTLIRPYKKTEVNTSQQPNITSISDIGRKVDRISVTLQHYIFYERCLVGAASTFLMNQNHPVRLRRIENAKTAFSENRKLEAKYKLDMVFLRRMPDEAQILSFSDTTDILRLTTRECFWAELYSEKRIVQFGWDAYVYFAGARLSKPYLDEFSRIGRVAEKVKYLRSGSAVS